MSSPGIKSSPTVNPNSSTPADKTRNTPSHLRAVSVEPRKANADSFEKTPSAWPWSSATKSTHLAPKPNRQIKPTYGERNLQKHMPRMSQGKTNACGTTTVSMSLAYLGVPSNFRLVDKSIRPWGDKALGSSPDDMVAYARRAGVQAQMYNDASIYDLVKHVEAGRAVTVLINTSGGSTHYVNVVGIERNAYGGIAKIKTRDPLKSGGDFSYEIKTFDQMWSDTKVLPGMKGIGNTLGSFLPLSNRFLMVMDKPEAPRLPQGATLSHLKMSAANGTLSGANGIGHSLTTIGKGHVIKGSLSLAGNSLKTAVSGANYVVGTAIGSNMEKGGDAAMATGLDMLEGNLLEQGGGWLMLVTGSAMKSVGWASNKAGGLASEGADVVAATADIGSNAINKRDETRDRILNNPRWSKEILPRASTQTKINMLDNLLLSGGRPSQRDQQAAALVLAAASQDAREYARVVGHFGGERALLNNSFRGAPFWLIDLFRKTR